MAKYGAVTLRNRLSKRNKMLFQHSTATKAVGIKVYVQRADTSKYHEKQYQRSAYMAWACPVRGKGTAAGGRHITRGFERCGPLAIAKTPTAAVKKALVNLGRKKGLR